MTVVNEVLEAIKAVSEGIENIRKISAAVRDGRGYLLSSHAEVSQDLATMCQEMRKSLLALATASTIVTHFRFVLGNNLSDEAARFNEHLLDQKLKAENVRQQLENMRGHCHVIRDHAGRIEGRAESKGLNSLFALFGLHSEAREKELAVALQEIYNDEMDFVRTVHAMEHAVKDTLQAVQNELGPAGAILPDQLPQAAATLGEYVPLFTDLENRAQKIADELEASIDVLVK